MSVCFFDDVSGGHHRSFLAGVVAASAGEGTRVIAASPERPTSLPPVHQWIQTPETPLRRVSQARVVLRQVVATCLLEDAGTFVDLYFDKNVWALPRSLTRVPRKVYVLHHAHQYSMVDRTLSGRARTVFLRQRVRALADEGARVIVHTRRAFEMLSPIVGTDRVILVGYPVRSSSEAERPHPADASPRDAEILFVGQARSEKGLADLLDAMEPLRDQIFLRVAGPQQPGVKQRLMENHPSLKVRWDTRFLDDIELRECFQQATLVALPYRAEFRRHGGASGVLLEALANGTPIVTTAALSPQLPADYRGAVVVPEDDRSALTDGITRGLVNTREFRRIAERDGPAFIRAHHTYEHYSREILH